MFCIDCVVYFMLIANMCLGVPNSTLYKVFDISGYVSFIVFQFRIIIANMRLVCKIQHDLEYHISVYMFQSLSFSLGL